jgi:hypothetical protein
MAQFTEGIPQFIVVAIMTPYHRDAATGWRRRQTSHHLQDGQTQDRRVLLFGLTESQGS